MVNVWNCFMLINLVKPTSIDHVCVESTMARLHHIMVSEPMNIWVTWLSITVILNLWGLSMSCSDEAGFDMWATIKGVPRTACKIHLFQKYHGKLTASFYEALVHILQQASKEVRENLEVRKLKAIIYYPDWILPC